MNWHERTVVELLLLLLLLGYFSERALTAKKEKKWLNKVVIFV